MTASNKCTISTESKRKIRYAVVGLGWIAQAAVLPAFAHAEDNSELAALVSDDPTKLEELSKKYGVKHTYSYDEYDDCLNSGEIDAVYIALPNHMHREYTVRAANAGIHVLCEKPMAVTEEECQRMIDACDRNGVKLMIAYRLHFEEANMKAVEIVKSGRIGDVQIFNSLFTQQVEEGNIRLREELGGGTLDDVGIYCINAARYLFRDEPIEVFAVSANTGESRFSEVDTTTSVILRFPNQRVANFTCSFGAAPTSTYRIVGTQGDLRLDPAYCFHSGMKHELTVNGETQEYTFEHCDQFAAILLHFSDCILHDKDPAPSGMEGLIDVRIIRALYKSIRTGKPVQLPDLEVEYRPTLAQTIKCPPIEKEPELIHAADPAIKS